MKNRLQLQPGPSGEIISNYSYRRASAGELILHYITVGPSPGIRNVIIIGSMVHKVRCNAAETLKNNKIFMWNTVMVTRFRFTVNFVREQENHF